MAIKLIANYSKRLGLPGFSSHQFSVSVETELTTTADLPGESGRLYHLLQSNVDEQILQTGFVPPADYGMDRPNHPDMDPPDDYMRGLEAGPRPEEDGPWAPADPTGWQNGPAWKCTTRQRNLILRLVEEHQMDKAHVEALALKRFNKAVRLLDKIEASGLIDEVIEAHGGTGPGRRVA